MGDGLLVIVVCQVLLTAWAGGRWVKGKPLSGLTIGINVVAIAWEFRNLMAQIP